MLSVMASEHNTDGLKGASRACGTLPSVLSSFYLVLLLCIVGGTALFAGRVTYAFASPLVKADGLWLCLGAVAACLCLVALVLCVRRFFGRAVAAALDWLGQAPHFGWCALAGAAVLFVVQLALFQMMGFVAGFDPAQLVDIANQSDQSEYLSIYPHNLFIEGVFTLIARVAWVFGCAEYGWLVGFGALCVSASVALAACVARTVAGALAGVVVFVVGAFWLGCSPTALTPYTDSYGMVWPVLVLYFYTCVPRTGMKWAGVAAASVVGAFMKAPSLAVLGAIVVVEVCQFGACALRKRASRSSQSATEGARRAWVRPVACALLAGAVAFCACTEVKNVPDVQIDSEKAVGPAHYLLMGVGPKLGAYSSAVYEFSTSFQTRAERDAADLEAWQKNVQELGFSGLMQFAVAKAFTVYGDGSFFWGGDTVQKVTGNNQDVLWFYGLADNLMHIGQNILASQECPFNVFANVVWFGVLIGCVLCLLRRTPCRVQWVIGLALLLFTLYVLVFEANPRYPALFAPLFLVLGTLGWQAFARWCARLLSRFRA